MVERDPTPPTISGLPEVIDVREGEPVHVPFSVHDEPDEPLRVYLQEAPPYCAVLWLDGGWVLEVSPGAAPPPPISEEQIKAIRADEARERIETHKSLHALLDEDLSEEEGALVREQIEIYSKPLNREIYEEHPGDASHPGRVVVRADDQRHITDFELTINVAESE